MIKKLSKVGNSTFLLISNDIKKHLGINEKSFVNLDIKSDSLIIRPVRRKTPASPDRSTWKRQFRKSFRKGEKPVASLWPENVSDQSDRNWVW